MFGTYRLLLALMVVAQHLGAAWGLGGYAVFGFFALSGYLMTLIMHSTYGYNRSGFFGYVINRILRIYPVYWAVCLFSVALVLWLGSEVTTGYNRQFFIPSELTAILRNIFIIVDSSYRPTLISPAWALSIELCFYLLIGLGLSRTKKITVLWFIVSAVYTIALNALGLPWEYKYFHVAAASLPFATGAFVFHFKDEIIARFRWLKSSLTPAVSFALIIFLWGVQRNTEWLYLPIFYVNFVLQVIIILSLVNKRSTSSRLRQIDKVFGDFSYPVYLIHIQAGLLLVGVDAPVQKDTPLFLLTALPLLLALSWILIVSVERRVESLRTQVKTRTTLARS